MATGRQRDARGSARPSRSFALGLVVGLVIAGILGAIVVAPVALTHHSAGNLEQAYGNAVVRLVTLMKGAGVGKNPTDGNTRLVEQAGISYTGSCSACHGALGDGKGVFGLKSFPPATNLTSSQTRALSDDQIFYIIKNGLGFTAMPAYASQYTDQEIWALTSYVRRLQAGQPVAAEVPTPSSDQLAAAKVQAGGDAQRGAAIWSDQACGTCHVPTGRLSINPANPSVQQALRSGRPGMPCFPTARISDA